MASNSTGSGPGSVIKETKGVVHGASFRFEPGPPPGHVCPEPVVVALIPDHQKAVIRSNRTLLQVLTFRKDRQATALRKTQGEIDTLIDATVARIRPPTPEERGRKWIHHPYDMMDAFNLLPEIPRELAADRRYLEKILYYSLFVYKTLMDRNGLGPIRFIDHAKEYLSTGYQRERKLPLVEDNPEDKLELCQQIYDEYFHGSRYYICALISGEEFEPTNSYFLYFCTAQYFMARLDWDGNLNQQPSRKKLPTRDEMLYYAMRDPSVVKQYKTNPDYGKNLMGVLRAFQSDMRTSHIVAKVRHQVRTKAEAAANATDATGTEPAKKHFRAARMKRAPK